MNPYLLGYGFLLGSIPPFLGFISVLYTSGIRSVFRRRSHIILILLGLSLPDARANDIEVTGVTFPSATISGSGTARTIQVNFTVRWKSSWRLSTGPANWDAAWVFFKFRKNNSTTWEHAWLSTTESDHTATQSSTYTHGNATIKIGTTNISGTDRGMGAFIYRGADGSGDVSWLTSLRWNFGADPSQAGGVEVKVFAIEMVYVPQGSFYVGSGGTETKSFTNGSWTSGNSIPLQVNSENALTIGQAAGNLWALNSALTASSLSASYPKGYAAFYCMKYEASQAQYRDFLNCLTRAQQASRVWTNIASGQTSITNRYVMVNSSSATTVDGSSLTHSNGIRCDATVSATEPINFYCDYDGDETPNESNDCQELAVNFAVETDELAYLDWAGLRPMTELEFEKSCRGTISPVANEYVWGTTSIVAASYTYSDAGTTSESIATNYGSGDARYSSTFGNRRTVRNGIFATTTSSRVQAGATYYGIQDMAGNMREKTVSVGSAAGRSYTGLHGNGALTSSGDANVDFWPGINNNSSGSVANTAFGGTTGCTGAARYGDRGGMTGASGTTCRISHREWAVDDDPGRATWSHGDGIRGVRTAQ